MSSFDLSEYLKDGEEFKREHVAEIRASLGDIDFNAFCEIVFSLTDEALEEAPEDRRVLIRAFKEAVIQ